MERLNAGHVVHAPVPNANMQIIWEENLLNHSSRPEDSLKEKSWVLKCASFEDVYCAYMNSLPQRN